MAKKSPEMELQELERRNREPAHEVILFYIESFCRLTAWVHDDLSRSVSEARLRLLLGILRQMIIPKRDISKIVSRLKRILRLKEVNQIAGYNAKVDIEETIKSISP